MCSFECDGDVGIRSATGDQGPGYRTCRLAYFSELLATQLLDTIILYTLV